MCDNWPTTDVRVIGEWLHCTNDTCPHIPMCCTNASSYNGKLKLMGDKYKWRNTKCVETVWGGSTMEEEHKEGVKKGGIYIEIYGNLHNGYIIYLSLLSLNC